MNYASVCDGIGAAHVAWQPLGWDCRWTSEIEPFPAAVVEQRFGFVNVGDMTKITEEMLDEHGPVDLLVGGTPCQSFSVAGLRGGLADPRGNLALRFVQLAAVMQPKWIVWENVPGVLSSGKGRDFGTFLGALGELGYGFAYRVLDAQWFGVAQRRRRVFVVGHLGDWRRAAAVLFERESVFGNPPTRGKTGASVARALSASTGGASAKEQQYTFVGDNGQPLNALGEGPIWRGGDQANSEHCIDHAGTLNCDKGQQGGILAFTKSKRAQSTTDDESWVPGEVSPTMSCFDQGDTRATTVVAFRENQRGEVDYVDPPHALASGGGKPGQGYCGVQQAMAVRRLTPRECERLQGFPDDYTLVEYRKKPAADGPRYRALGNSMAVPVMRWIGERIAMVESKVTQ
jgi:DNA (cytosine-5)-methyltransferase 1